MANRHLSRSIVLQTLFELDFNKFQDLDVRATVARNIREFALGMEDDAFVYALADQVIKKRAAVDEIIEKAAPEWPLSKISLVDRNILRIGLCELLFGNRREVPPKVAINEAIELAKTFGGENSGKFVNGVLGAVYKEIGEPGKEETSKKKNNSPVDPGKLPVEKFGGALVYAREGGNLYLALVHDVFGYWTLSKGHIDSEETEEEGTMKRIKEEIGLPIEIKEKLGDNEYVASHPEKGKILKKVAYFLAESEYRPFHFEPSGGLDEAKWFQIKEVPELRIYNDIIPLIGKAIEIISKQP